jgi:hypothetical protein
MRTLTILLLAVTLSGCMTAQEREAADDNVCRTARDYAICRQNLMSGRRDAAVRASGGDIIVSGPPHHWSLD